MHFIERPQVAAPEVTGLQITGRDQLKLAQALVNNLCPNLHHQHTEHFGRNYLELGGDQAAAFIRLKSTRLNPLSFGAWQDSPSETDNLGYFERHALRVLIQQHYSWPGHTAPPNFFRENQQFNAALVGYLATLNIGSTSLRIKEIGAGNYLSRWDSGLPMDSHPNLSLEVTLSDITLNNSPFRSAQPGIQVNSLREDLYSTVEALPHDKKYHVILGTYLLDSLTFSRDRILRKFNDSWYEVLLRPLDPEMLNVDDTVPHLRIGYEWITVPVQLENSTASLLSRFFPTSTTGFVHYPQGTIDFLVTLAENHLAIDGALIFGDIGAIETAAYTRRPISFTPEGAPFVHTQMPLLKALAILSGLQAETLPVSDFVERYVLLPNEERLKGTRELINSNIASNHGVLILRRH